MWVINAKHPKTVVNLVYLIVSAKAEEAFRKNFNFLILFESSYLNNWKGYTPYNFPKSSRALDLLGDFKQERHIAKSLM